MNQNQDEILHANASAINIFNAGLKFSDRNVKIGDFQSAKKFKLADFEDADTKAHDGEISDALSVHSYFSFIHKRHVNRLQSVAADNRVSL